MRRGARLGIGRVLASGTAIWFRRFLPIHAVAAVCLAPLALWPDSRHELEDVTMAGLYGLHSAAWVVTFDLVDPYAAGLVRNVTVVYLAQFALTVILVRDAHRRLAGRDGTSRVRAIAGLLPYALASLAAFVALDFVAMVTWPGEEWGLLVASMVETALAAWFWLGLPAAAVDGCGFLASLGRSRRLARGTFVRVAALPFLLVVLQMAAALLCAVVSDEPWTLVLGAVLFLPLKACVLAAAYREICLLKEGPRPEELGAIFA